MPFPVMPNEPWRCLPADRRPGRRGVGRSVPGRLLVDLKELSFDGPHPGHQPVELGQISLLVLRRLLDEIGGCAVVNAVKRVGQLPVQERQALFEGGKLLAKLSLLDHC
jgi:hypothetical protein